VLASGDQMRQVELAVRRSDATARRIGDFNFLHVAFSTSDYPLPVPTKRTPLSGRRRDGAAADECRPKSCA
jgi:hypothetical protein